MSFGIIVVGLLGLGAVVWVLLDRHEARRAANGKPRHSALRLIFGAAALMIMLFSGGCGLLFLTAGQSQYVDVAAVAIFTLPPLLVGLLIWWLAMRRESI